jgi:hypothetical protein
MRVEQLRKAVAEQDEIVASAVTLLAGLSRILLQLRGHPRALRQLAADLDAQREELAAALVHGTPAEPAISGASRSRAKAPAADTAESNAPSTESPAEPARPRRRAEPDPPPDPTS